MLETVPMQKIKVVGLRKDLPQVISFLHENGTAQFKKVEDSRVDADRASDKFSAISEQLVRLQGIQKVLIPQEGVKPEKEKNLDEVLEECRGISIDKRLGEIQERLEAIGKDEIELHEARKILESLSRGPRMRMQSEKKYILGKISNENLEVLKGQLDEVTGDYKIASKELDRLESLFAIAFDKKFDSRVEQILSGLEFVQRNLPKISESESTILESVDSEIKKLDAEKDGLTNELLAISKQNWGNISSLLEMLQIEADRAKAPLNFGRTQNLFVFEAWLPKSRFITMERGLRQITGNKVSVEKIGESEELAPTLLKNPGFLSPFEFMVEFLSIPKSNELDPTVVLALTLPLFYGMMLGDVGYGLLSLVFAIILMKKTSGIMVPIAKVWAISAIPAIAFGVIFDEYLGMSHTKILELLGFGNIQLYHPIERLANIQLLLLVTIFMGAFHIGLGFFFGFINAWKRGEVRHALAKLGWLSAEISGILLVGSYYNASLGVPAIESGATLIASIAVIISGEGLVSAIELLSLAGNILSYTRIAAIGVSSLAIAAIINQFLLPNPSAGLWFFVMIPIYMLLHIFNLALGMFESLVQSARLNYVEFFSKFYEGGGQKFDPFKYVRKYTIG